MLDKFRHKLYRANYVLAPSLNHKTPIDVSLELASVCNQRCSYCYHANQATLPFKKGMMSLKTAHQIIAQSADLRVPAIKFNWKGESTLNPYFKEITQFAKDHATKSTFIDRLTNSNFKFATENDAIFDGLCNQTKVKVSFDSFIPSVMEKQRAGSIHSVALLNIDKFYRYKNRKDTEIVIQAVRTSLNKDEDIEKTAKKRWPGVSVSIRDMVSGRIDNNEVKELENVTRDLSERQTCIQAHARLIFNWDGKAMPCCPDIGEKLQVGDINEQTVYQIFNSKPAKELRRSLLDKSAFLKEPCKSCPSFESFKGYRPNWKS